MTLRKFHLLVKRLSVNYKVEEYRNASIRAAIYETSRTSNTDRHWTPEDFLPGKKKEISSSDMLRKIENLNMMFGGIDNRN